MEATTAPVTPKATEAATPKAKAGSRSDHLKSVAAPTTAPLSALGEAAAARTVLAEPIVSSNEGIS